MAQIRITEILGEDYHLTLMVVVTPTFVMGKFLTNFDFKLRKSPRVSCGIAANNFNTGV